MMFGFIQYAGLFLSILVGLKFPQYLLFLAVVEALLICVVWWQSPASNKIRKLLKKKLV